MKILLTNDDGICAQGIRILASALSREHEVTIVAPEGEQSGAGHSITVKRPLTVEPVNLGWNETIRGYKVDGTPADCVTIACKALKLEPDVILSGINHGYNLGNDIFYSGTVSAAMEGALLGIPSIAISAGSGNVENLELSANVAKRLLSELLLQNAKLYNINVPPEAKNIKYTPLSPSSCGNTIGSMEKRKDPRGREYYWRPASEAIGENEAACDRTWAEKGYVTITPMRTDLTDYQTMDPLG